MWVTTPRIICRVPAVSITAETMNTVRMFPTRQATTIPITAVTTAVAITAATQATTEEIIQAENLQAEGNPQAEESRQEAVNRQEEATPLLRQNKITG